MTPADENGSVSNDNEYVVEYLMDNNENRCEDDSTYSNAAKDPLDFFEDSSDDSNIPEDGCCATSDNVIVSVASLMSAVNTVVTYHHCAATKLTSFFDFCDAMMEKLFHDAECKFRNDKYRFQCIRKMLNIREWYSEWETGMSVNTSSPELTMKTITYGLASNLSISCKSCNTMDTVLSRIADDGSWRGACSSTGLLFGLT